MTDSTVPRQLTLLPSSEVPVQFRIDAATRERGLRHIAEIRQRLADREAERAKLDEPLARRPVRPTAA